MRQDCCTQKKQDEIQVIIQEKKIKIEDVTEEYYKDLLFLNEIQENALFNSKVHKLIGSQIFQTQSEENFHNSSEVLTSSIIIQNIAKQNEILQWNQNSQIQRMAVIKKSLFFFPFTCFNQEQIVELNQYILGQKVFKYRYQEIDGIKFIYLKQQSHFFRTDDRFCQVHNDKISHICLEKSCIQSQKSLICTRCFKYHKYHNFAELQELIAFVKGRQIQLQKTEFYFNLMFQQQPQKLKNKAQKLNQPSTFEFLILQHIKLNEKIQNYITQQNQFFQEIMKDLVDGSSSKIIEAVAKIFEKEGTQLDLQQINFKFSDYVRENKEILDKLQYTPQFKDYTQNQNISILIEERLLKINGDYIQTYNDLDVQIKIELIRNGLFEFFFYDLLWLQENQAIRLCENNENVEKSTLQNSVSLKIIFIV